MEQTLTAFGQISLKANVQEHFAQIALPYEQGQDGVTVVKDQGFAFIPEAECNDRQRRILESARLLGYPEMVQGKRRTQAILDFPETLPRPKVTRLTNRGKPEIKESDARAFHVLRPSGSFDWAELDVPDHRVGDRGEGQA